MLPKFSKFVIGFGSGPGNKLDRIGNPWLPGKLPKEFKEGFVWRAFALSNKNISKLAPGLGRLVGGGPPGDPSNKGLIPGDSPLIFLETLRV